MDVSKIGIGIVEKDGIPCLRIRGWVTLVDGVYVDIPLDPTEIPLTREQLNILVTQLDNGFTTLNWICDQPEEAAASGCISAEDLPRIQRLKEST